MQRALPGDLADWRRRPGDVRLVEVQALTAKRVKVGVRLEDGSLAVRYVKPEKLKRSGGGYSMPARDLARERIVRLLVERLRHRPAFLTVKQTVQLVRRLIRHAVPAAAGCDCVLWGGAVNNDGYGRISARIAGRHFKLYVHRLVVQLAGHTRDIPHWKEAAHACDNPACFSPLCVELQRRRANRRKSAENTHRKLARRRLRALRERRDMRMAA